MTKYYLTYTSNDKTKLKTYEIVSRNSNIETEKNLKNITPNGVIIIVTDILGRILLNKEFRIAANQYIYNFPCGLIESNESILNCAVRELQEETGYQLITNNDKYPIQILPPNYSAIGITNETTCTIIGTIVQTTKPTPHRSDFEEIKANWYTKEEVQQLLKTKPFASKTQIYCTLWADA